MNYLENIKHHATLFVHPLRQDFTKELWDTLNTKSPAHTLYDQTVLDIDTARALTRFSNTPYEGMKVALISFHTITLPAQNALLKIFEEPRADVSFILVTSNKEAIIPTLYSRLQEQHLEISNTHESMVSEFLKTPPGKRMKLPAITELLAKTDEEGRKDREAVRNFLVSLATKLREKNKNQNHSLTTLQFASYAADPSASGKSILEYLSLLLPQSS